MIYLLKIKNGEVKITRAFHYIQNAYEFMLNYLKKFNLYEENFTRLRETYEGYNYTAFYVDNLCKCYSVQIYD